MADGLIQSSFDLRSLLWAHVPKDTPPELVDGLGDFLWQQSHGGDLMLSEDWQYLARDLGRVLEVVRSNVTTAEGVPVSDSFIAGIAESSRNMLLHMIRSMVPIVPVPPNTFHVGKHGEDVWVARPFKSRMGTANALSLACWLAYVADPEMKTFLPMLQALVEK